MMIKQNMVVSLGTNIGLLKGNSEEVGDRFLSHSFVSFICPLTSGPFSLLTNMLVAI